MTDPKKPGANDLNDLKARLGISSQPAGGVGVPAPPGGIAPPAFGPGSAPPMASPGPSGAPAVIPPPGLGSTPPGSGVPAPIGLPTPGGMPAVGSNAPARQSDVPPPAVSPSVPVIAPPSFAPPSGSPVAAPVFGAKPNVAPPPFAQEDDEEPEEEIIREERVVRIEADESLDASEAGRSTKAPYLAVGAAFVIAALFGYLAGAQIDRAVLANRAIGAAVVIRDAVVADQEIAKNLKSRISGAARKAIDPDNPSADFVLLSHLQKVRAERPFSADIWADEFYQAFKSRQLVFEYYRAVQDLWDLVDETAETYSDPEIQRALKAWPEERQRVLKINDTKGGSGYGIAFRSEGGKVLALLGTFKNSRRESVGRKSVYQSEFDLLGGGESKTRTEYQPSFDPLSENPDEYFIRVNPDIVVGKKRQVLNPGGPFISEGQDPYRQYLGDLNQLSKAVLNVQAQQDNLIQSLQEISQAPRPFTFGF